MGRRTCARFPPRAPRTASLWRCEAGKTTTLGFGPPYKPRVTAVLADDTAHLGLAIVGAEGEVVSNLVLNGRRPEKPKVTITGAKGKVVAQGDFEYG